VLLRGVCDATAVSAVEGSTGVSLRARGVRAWCTAPYAAALAVLAVRSRCGGLEDCPEADPEPAAVPAAAACAAVLKEALFFVCLGPSPRKVLPSVNVRLRCMTGRSEADIVGCERKTVAARAAAVVAVAQNTSTSAAQPCCPFTEALPSACSICRSGYTGWRQTGRGWRGLVCWEERTRGQFFMSTKLLFPGCQRQSDGTISKKG